MAGIQGITGLQSISGDYVVEQPETTPFERFGDPADPRHAKGLIVEQYPWQDPTGRTPQTNPGPVDDYIGQVIEAQDAGIAGVGTPYWDATPNTHGGPWPAGLDQTAGPAPPGRESWGSESYALHSDGLDFNLPMQATRLAVEPSKKLNNENNDPSDNLQEAVPQQVALSSGGGLSTDAFTNPRGRNDYGMGAAHRIHARATSHMPGNYQWLKPGGRPMVVTRFDTFDRTGVDSPFYGQDQSEVFQVDNSGILLNPAGEYEPPADPYQPAPLTQQSLIEGPLV
jgi:hypothetical protein